MKKVILFGLLALSLNFQAKAQDGDSKVEEVLNANRFGLFIGLGSTWLHNKADVSDPYAVAQGKGKFGFSFGLNAERVLNERYAIYTGLNADWEGGQITSGLQNGKSFDTSSYVMSSDVSYKLQYVRLPIGLKLKAANIADFRLFGQIGADLGVLISKKEDISRTVWDATTLQSKVINETGVKNSNTNPINVGYHVGIGAEYDVTDKNAVYLTILYQNGLIDVTLPKTNSAGYRFEDGNVSRNSFGIRIGYFF